LKNVGLGSKVRFANTSLSLIAYEMRSKRSCAFCPNPLGGCYTTEAALVIDKEIMQVQFETSLTHYYTTPIKQKPMLTVGLSVTRWGISKLLLKICGRELNTFAIKDKWQLITKL